MVDNTKLGVGLNGNCPKLARLVHYWPIGMLILMIILIGTLNSEMQVRLRYERNSILEDQQYWRLLTAHLVHVDWRHTLLNVGALLLITVLFSDVYKAWQWLCVGLCTALGVDLGLLCLMPRLDWYVGLSGVLHGVLLAGALGCWRINQRAMALTVVVVVFLKLFWEQWYGVLPLSTHMAVITNAHVYGALSGLLVSLVLRGIQSS